MKSHPPSIIPTIPGLFRRRLAIEHELAIMLWKDNFDLVAQKNCGFAISTASVCRLHHTNATQDNQMIFPSYSPRTYKWQSHCQWLQFETDGLYFQSSFVIRTFPFDIIAKKIWQTSKFIAIHRHGKFILTFRFLKTKIWKIKLPKSVPKVSPKIPQKCPKNCHKSGPPKYREKRNVST